VAAFAPELAQPIAATSSALHDVGLDSATIVGVEVESDARYRLWRAAATANGF
jgi:hypothetical protein